MARVTDYIGRSFGDFTIVKLVDHGATAEVFACAHDTTGLVYILRLAADDQELWRGEPVIPPRNQSIEVPNATGTWHMAPMYYQATMENFRKKGNDEWVIVPAPIYGVLDQRYLVPVASPVRVKGAWEIDRLLTAAAADDLYLFELWEDFLGTLAGAAYQSTTVLRNNVWRRLTGGKILSSAITKFLRNGTLSKQQQADIVAAASASQVEGPELAENIILRMCGCLQRGRMSIDEAVATLQCRHFRINITYHECQQMVNVYNILRDQPWGAEKSIAVLQFILLELGKPPADQHHDADKFEIRKVQPDLSPYSLFLQEYAGVSQEVIVLKTEKRQ